MRGGGEKCFIGPGRGMIERVIGHVTHGALGEH